MPNSKREPPLDPIEEYFFYVGLLTAYWNKAEGELDDLLACFIGDEKVAHILAGNQPIATRTAYLKRIVEQCHPGAKWHEVMTTTLDAFDVLRQNRNTIIHGTATRLDSVTGAVAVRAATKNPAKKSYRIVAMNKDEVVKQLDLVIRMGNQLAGIRARLYRGGPGAKLSDLFRFGANPTLPGKFPQVEQLPDLPTLDPKAG